MKHLFFLFYTKNKIRELILFVQVALLVIVMGLTVTPFEAVYKIYTGSVSLAAVGEGNNPFNVTAAILSPEILSAFKFSLPGIQEGGNGVYISAHLAQRLNIGDALTLKKLNRNNTSIELSVAGILPSGYGFVNGDTDFICKVEKDEDYIILENAAIPAEYFSWNPSFMFSLKKGVGREEYVKQLNDKYSEYGQFELTETILKDRLSDTVRQDKWNILIFILLFGVLIFGFCGYTIFRLMNKRTVFSALYICGMSKKKILLMNMLSAMVIFIPATVFSVIATPYILRNFSFADFNGLSGGYYAVLSVFILFMLGSCALLSTIMTNSDSLLTLCKTEEAE